MSIAVLPRMQRVQETIVPPYERMRIAEEKLRSLGLAASRASLSGRIAVDPRRFRSIAGISVQSENEFLVEDPARIVFAAPSPLRFLGPVDFAEARCFEHLEALLATGWERLAAATQRTFDVARRYVGTPWLDVESWSVEGDFVGPEGAVTLRFTEEDRGVSLGVQAVDGLDLASEERPAPIVASGNPQDDLRRLLASLGGRTGWTQEMRGAAREVREGPALTRSGGTRAEVQLTWSGGRCRARVSRAGIRGFSARAIEGDAPRLGELVKVDSGGALSPGAFVLPPSSGPPDVACEGDMWLAYDTYEEGHVRAVQSRPGALLLMEEGSALDRAIETTVRADMMPCFARDVLSASAFLLLAWVSVVLVDESFHEGDWVSGAIALGLEGGAIPTWLISKDRAEVPAWAESVTLGRLTAEGLRAASPLPRSGALGVAA